jgi:acyl carrier protein
MDASDLDRIRGFVGDLLREHDDHDAFTDSESLINVGRLDSLSVVKLVTFLEGDFEVDFGEVEFDPQRLDSVDGIAAVVEEYRALG